MKQWKIPMTWKVSGVYKVEAETEEEAKQQALAWYNDLPCGIYIDNTLEIIEEKITSKELTLQNE